MQVKPIDVRKESESLQFFTILNAMLAYMPMLNEEAGLRSRFAKIGIVPGAPFEATGRRNPQGPDRGHAAGIDGYVRPGPGP